MNLHVLVASLLLFLPCCWAGGACPAKMELKTCNCRLINLKRDVAPPQIRHRREIPLTMVKMPVSATSTHQSINTHTTTHQSKAIHTSTPFPVRSSEDFSHTDNTVSIEQSTHRALNNEVIGRRFGYHYPDDEFDDHTTTDQPLGFLSRSMGAQVMRLPNEPPHGAGAFQLTIVDCKEPKTITEFEEILLFALHRRSVDKLIVSHLPPPKEETLARLPSRGMRNTRIKQFEIRDTALSGDFIWNGNPFDGQANSLLRFAANRCYLYGALTYEDPGTINTKGLNQLPYIEVVDFSINHLTIVKATAFKFPPANLSSIVLSKNSLQILEPGCFLNVSQLKLVDLSHNLLKTVIRTMFSAPARFLETVNLSENFLDALPADFFVNMPALRTVNLAKNFLHSVPEKPWVSVWKQLLYVDFTGNFLYCDCNLMWLLTILSPTKSKTSSTPSPSPLPGQTIRGSCTFNQMPNYTPIQHSLGGLTRGMLMC